MESEKFVKSLLSSLILVTSLVPVGAFGEIYMSLDAEGGDFSVKSDHLWNIFDNGYTWKMGNGRGNDNGTKKPWRTSNIARQGHYSVVLELDPPTTNYERQRVTYLTRTYKVYSGTTKNRYFGFSVLRDNHFPDDVWECIAELQTTKSPIISIYKTEEPVGIKIRYAWGDRTAESQKDEIFHFKDIKGIQWPKHKWMDFIVYTNVNPYGNAEFKVWLNGDLIVNKGGSNFRLGYINDDSQTGQWEFQMYGSTAHKRRRLYFDNVRLASTNDEADPSKWGKNISDTLDAPTGLRLSIVK